MRNLVTIAAAAVIALIVLVGLRWLGLISQEAIVIGFATGVAIAVVMALANRRKGGTG